MTCSRSMTWSALAPPVYEQAATAEPVIAHEVRRSRRLGGWRITAFTADGEPVASAWGSTVAKAREHVDALVAKYLERTSTTPATAEPRHLLYRETLGPLGCAVSIRADGLLTVDVDARDLDEAKAAAFSAIETLAGRAGLTLNDFTVTALYSEESSS